jgi:hypothetical protein
MIIDRPALLDFARVAQECFFRQTWPLRQLVVFNATGTPLNRWQRRRVREIQLRRLPRPLMLHILRENADGEWCVLWDADCWYDPSVIDLHVRAAEHDTTVLFRHTTAYSLTDRKAYVISDDRIQHGSFLRLAKIDFEKPFYRQTPRLKLVDAPAHCVVKFVNKILYEE